MTPAASLPRAPRAVRSGSALRFACESIERRLLMCALPHENLPPAPAFDWAVEQREAALLDGPEGGPEATSIVWSNRGQASDNFAATFGTRANTARAVVDAALNHWERVITSWNRADGTTTLQVNISMGGGGFGGAGAPAGAAPADGKPRTGSFTLTTGNNDGDPNSSNGWYLDPNPNDHTEFNTAIIDAFAGRGTGLGPDLYSVVVSELTHVLGLISDKNNNGGSWNGYLLESSGFLTNTNVVDNAEGGGSFGRFWTFNGPTVDHLMTTYNSGDATSASWGNIVHSAGIRSTQLSFGGQNWQGADDVGNAIFSGSERTIPSWAVAHVLRDAYGYSIADPEQFDTFYANLNRTTGALTVRGGDFQDTGGVSNDDITINVDGSELVVSVNVSNDVPGTRHLSGAGNLPAWTTRFPLADVNSIVVNADAGNDAITVSGLGSGMPMTINAGDGDDFIDVGGGDFDTNILSNITIIAGAGTDDVVVIDLTDGFGSDTYNISATQLAKTFVPTVLSWNPTNAETFALIGSGNDDAINLTGASSLMSYTLGGNGGTDTVNIGNGDFDGFINGAVTVSGGAGNDTVIVDDTSDTGNDTYQVAGNQFEKTTFGTGSLRALNGTELMVVNGSDGNNTYSVPQLSSFLDLTLNGGTGGDDFTGFFNNNFDANLLSSVTFNGGAGSDSVTVNDQAGPGLVYNLDNNSLDKGGAGVLNYAACEAFTLNCNAGDNDINVLSTFSNCPLTVNGNSGDDTLNVGGAGTFMLNFGSDISFNGGGGTGDDVSISDAGFAGTGTYTVTNGHVALPFNAADVFHAAAETLIVAGSQGDNVFNVNQNHVLALIAGEGGDDTINVGNGNFAANITADVIVLGGAGADVAFVQDALVNTSDVWTVTTNGVTKSTASASMVTSFFGPTIDAVVVNAGGGNATFNVNGIGSSTTSQDLTINAGGGDDTFNVAMAGGSLSGAIHGDVAVNGDAGADHLYINDTSDAGNDNYTTNSTALTKSDWAHALAIAAVESKTLDANGGANVVTVTGAHDNTVIRGNGGADTIDVQGNLAGTYVTVDGGAGLDAVVVNSDVLGGARVQFNDAQDLAALRVYNGGTARLNAGGNRLITTNILDVTGSGVVNLTDNAMVVDYAGASPLATIQSQLNSGFAAGAWNGSGINSSTAAAGTSTAVGYAEASEVFAAFPAAFEGASVDNTSVLLKHTFYGDTDLSGNVNLQDFNRLAANFGQSPRRWVHGNFDFDNDVDLPDFNRLAANFGATGLGPDARLGTEEELPSLEDLTRPASRRGGLSDDFT